MLNLLGHDNKVREINQYLSSLENKYKIKILYAVVVGSRQFNLNLLSSDWDIRFVYTHSLDWYFKSNDREFTITGKEHDIDYQGYSLPKAITSIIKSNGAFIEWMSSPLIIRSQDKVWNNKWEGFLKQFYNPRRIHHYYHALATNAEKEIKEKGWDMKVFLIYIRAILSMEQLNYFRELPCSIDSLIFQSDKISEYLKYGLHLAIDRYRNGLKINPFDLDIVNVSPAFNILHNEYHGDPVKYPALSYIDPIEIDNFHMDTVLNSHQGNKNENY